MVRPHAGSLALAATLAISFFQFMPSAADAQMFDFDLVLESPRPMVVIPPPGDWGTNTEIHYRLTNTGTQEDTYTISRVSAAPVGWDIFTCDTTYCVLDESFMTNPVSPGGEDPIYAIVWPNMIPGSCTIAITVRSSGDPSKVTTVRMGVIALTEHVLVDADGGESYETYFQSAIDARGSDYGTWDTTIDALQSGDLDSFVWAVVATNDADGNPDYPDTGFFDYLDTGGRAVLSGQNNGEMLDGTPYMTDYLHAELISPSVVGTTVNGETGDVIGDGLSFSIVGGTGAGNQTSPDGISPLGGAETALTYSSGEDAGIYVAEDPYMLVYLAFGMEGIATEADRDLLMDHCLDWLEGDFPTAVPGSERELETLLAVRAAPLPAAGEVELRFSVPAGPSQPARLAIFDARGRRVREINAGRRSPGPHIVTWDGRDAGSQPVGNGLYFYRLSVGAEKATGKLVIRR